MIPSLRETQVDESSEMEGARSATGAAPSSAEKIRGIRFMFDVTGSFRMTLHSPSALWDTKPVGEHLACNASRLSQARTVAGWLA